MPTGHAALLHGRTAVICSTVVHEGDNVEKRLLAGTVEIRHSAETTDAWSWDPGGVSLYNKTGGEGIGSNGTTGATQGALRPLAATRLVETLLTCTLCHGHVTMDGPRLHNGRRLIYGRGLHDHSGGRGTIPDRTWAVSAICKMSHTVRGIWTGFPSEPEESGVVSTILELGSTSSLISRLYRALKKDRRIMTMGMHETWNRELKHPLTEGECKLACAQVKMTASNARFKLTQF
mgnify:CR=1 FL=1